MIHSFRAADLRDGKHTMILKEEKQYKDYVREIELITDNIDINTVIKHLEIEKILMRIQCIPSMPKRPSYINIIQLEPGRILNTKEIDFLQAVTPYIDRDIFKSQRHYSKFICLILRIYKNTVDANAIRRVKELKGSFWEPLFLEEIT